MEITTQVDPVHADRWLFAEGDGQPQIGVHLPKETHIVSHDAALTVYWRGAVERSRFFIFINQTEGLLEKTALDVQATCYAYGEQRVRFGPAPAVRLDEWLRSTDKKFDAYRAELASADGTVVIWANVSGELTPALENGGENIGVSVPSKHFLGVVRPAITSMIEASTKLGSGMASGFLHKILQTTQTRDGHESA